MIVIDTNIISEITRAVPDQRVVDWIAVQRREDLYLASPVLAELLAGLFRMPTGARRRLLEIVTSEILESYFGQRSLVFDHDAAWYFAEVIARAQEAGRTIAPLDGQIAAIALQWSASVATRDIAPFLTAGVTTINPWTD